MASLDPSTLSMLAVIGLIGGVGITAIGPGGVLATIGLFTLTDLTTPQVAGTAIVTHIGTGILATAVYVRSGQLRERHTRRDGATLAVMAVVGTPLGVLLNRVASERAFGILLAALVLTVAGLVWLRERRGEQGNTRRHPRLWVIAAIGTVVAVASGVVGVGGPMLTVPLLVALGVPVLSALAASQAQSIVIATVGSLGYLTSGAIDWPLAAIVGVPELAGVVLGWAIAHRVPTRALKYTLVAALLAVAPYLALTG